MVIRLTLYLLPLKIHENWFCDVKPSIPNRRKRVFFRGLNWKKYVFLDEINDSDRYLHILSDLDSKKK